jgi:hypothetical protein
LTLGLAAVSIAHRSLATAKTNSQPSNGMSHRAKSAVATAAPAVAIKAVAMTTLALRPGARIVNAASTKPLSVRTLDGLKTESVIYQPLR